MKILFVFPDFGYVKNRQGQTILETGGWYSEGIGSLAASLEQAGHEVALYHLSGPVERSSFVERLQGEKPDLVAFSVRTQVFWVAVEYAGWAKEAGFRTIFGSYHATVNPDETIAQDAVDMLCVGEGEVPLVELCNRSRDGVDYSDVAGLWLKSEQGVIKNAVGPLVVDIDSLPIPKFDLFDFDSLISTETFTAMASFTRGCPYSCTYCINNKLKSLYPNRNHFLRTRSPENSMEYLRKLREVYPGMRYLRIMDDIFHYSEDWLATFLPMYQAEFGLPFAINHRPNVFSERAAKMLAEAGCYQVYFGVESGNERIRNQVIGRRMGEQQIVDAFRWAREAGIRTSAYNMVGLPHGALATVLDTIKLNARIRPNRIFSPVFCPYPNTELHDISVAGGFCEPNTNYEEDVMLNMPQFPARKVLFARANFRNMVHAYQLAYALPGPLAGVAESALDRFFLNPHLPYRLLTRLADGISDGMEEGKTVIRRTAPEFYVFLRDKVIGNRL